MSINLNYRVQAFWNGSLVCDGNMSGTLALALANELGASFAGRAAQDAAAEIAGLRFWLFVKSECIITDNQINCLWGDETGSACIRVTRREVK